MKYVFLLPVLIFLFGCGNSSTPTKTEFTDTLCVVKSIHPNTDPHPRWREVDKLLKETMSAPIGKFPCPFGKTLKVKTVFGSNGGEFRDVPCNCGTFIGVNMIIVDDTISPFAGEFEPNGGFIELNRYAIKRSYKVGVELLKKEGIDSLISFERYANSILQQEYWHSQQSHTGSDVEFNSDVVSIKIAGEYFLVQSLINLVSHAIGEIGPNTYSEEYEKYLQIFKEAGLDSGELVCKKGEQKIERVKDILKKYPKILTKVKNIIISRY